MSNPDLRTPGERALLEVRAARVMLQIASQRRHSAESLLAQLSAIRNRQPALAASIMFQQALKVSPRHRLMLLESARDMIQEHGMSPDADREAARAATEHIERLIADSQGAIARWEKLLDRISSALGKTFWITIIALIAYYAHKAAYAPDTEASSKTQAESKENVSGAKPRGPEGK